MQHKSIKLIFIALMTLSFMTNARCECNQGGHCYVNSYANLIMENLQPDEVARQGMASYQAFEKAQNLFNAAKEEGMAGSDVYAAFITVAGNTFNKDIKGRSWSEKTNFAIAKDIFAEAKVKGIANTAVYNAFISIVRENALLVTDVLDEAVENNKDDPDTYKIFMKRVSWENQFNLVLYAFSKAITRSFLASDLSDIYDQFKTAAQPLSEVKNKVFIELCAKAEEKIKNLANAGGAYTTEMADETIDDNKRPDAKEEL